MYTQLNSSSSDGLVHPPIDRLDILNSHLLINGRSNLVKLTVEHLPDYVNMSDYQNMVMVNAPIGAMEGETPKGPKTLPFPLDPTKKELLRDQGELTVTLSTSVVSAIFCSPRGVATIGIELQTGSACLLCPHQSEPWNINRENG